MLTCMCLTFLCFYLLRCVFSIEIDNFYGIFCTRDGFCVTDSDSRWGIFFLFIDMITPSHRTGCVVVVMATLNAMCVLCLCISCFNDNIYCFQKKICRLRLGLT